MNDSVARPESPEPSKAGNALDARALQQLQEHQKELLDAIDGLRDLGVGQLVDLPQIIVVGDQSSGKSSVLEAISRVRFPMKDGLCTRFATELILRTDSQAKFNVSIEPSTSSLDASKKHYSFNESKFDRSKFPLIIEDASRHMGLGNSSTGFSEDVLRVEVSGPDIPQLTLVDLPGIYHAASETQSQLGSQVVERLVDKYMANESSIILAVVSARSDIVLQKVLSMAKKHDPKRERTLGIITKADTVPAQTNEEKRFIRLASNLEASQTLAHGWHVLRNRKEGEEKFSDEERDEKEAQFFASGNWGSVPPMDRGIDALRRKLSKVLLDHIEEKMPKLIQSIEENIRDRRMRLIQLGEPRSTPEELRSYLIKIATRFESLAHDAIRGNYVDEFFGGLRNTDRVRKLRATVRDLSRAFDMVLDDKGSKNLIVKDKEDIPRPFARAPDFLQPFLETYEVPEPQPITVKEFAEDIKSLAATNQGTEFPGSPNNQLALVLFRDQSEKWESIAKHHITLVKGFCKLFVETLIRYISGQDTNTCNALLRDCVDSFFEAKDSILEEKLQELLLHYKTGYGLCLEDRFRDRLARRERERLAKLVIGTLKSSEPDIFSEKPKRISELSLEVSIERALDSPTEFGTDSIIDNIVAYYNLSRSTLAENVIILAVENCLIRDIPKVLSLDSIYKMDEAKLKALAAEPLDVQYTRGTTQAELETLKKGLAVCQRYNKTRIPTALPKGLDRFFATLKNAEKPSSQSELEGPVTGAGPVQRGKSPMPAPGPQNASANSPAPTTFTPTSSNSGYSSTNTAGGLAGSSNVKSGQGFGTPTDSNPDTSKPIPGSGAFGSSSSGSSSLGTPAANKTPNSGGTGLFGSSSSGPSSFGTPATNKTQEAKSSANSGGTGLFRSSSSGSSSLGTPAANKTQETKPSGPFGGFRSSPFGSSPANKTSEGSTWKAQQSSDAWTTAVDQSCIAFEIDPFVPHTEPGYYLDGLACTDVFQNICFGSLKGYSQEETRLAYYVVSRRY